jgi:hypothetical protein
VYQTASYEARMKAKSQHGCLRSASCDFVSIEVYRMDEAIRRSLYLMMVNRQNPFATGRLSISDSKSHLSLSVILASGAFKCR